MVTKKQEETVNPQVEVQPGDEHLVGTTASVFGSPMPEVVVDAVEDYSTQSRGEPLFNIRVNREIEEMTVAAGGVINSYSFKVGQVYRVPRSIAIELEMVGAVYHWSPPEEGHMSLITVVQTVDDPPQFTPEPTASFTGQANGAVGPFVFVAKNREAVDGDGLNKMNFRVVWGDGSSDSNSGAIAPADVGAGVMASTYSVSHTYPSGTGVGGRTYTATVYATDVQGTVSVRTFTVATVAVVPAAPVISSIVRSGGVTTVTLGSFLTGGTITDYTYNVGGGAFGSAAATASPFVITAAIGAAVTIKAVNSAGTSAASASSTVTSASTVAATPTITSAYAVSTSTVITFTQGSDGGEPITNYKVKVNGGSYTALGAPDATSPITVTASAGDTVNIKAVNEVGDSAASNTFTVLAAAAPVAPVITYAVGLGGGVARVEFTQGSDNGRPITNYTVKVNGGSYTALSPVDAASPISITANTGDSITLKATNAVGDSVDSLAFTIS